MKKQPVLPPQIQQNMTLPTVGLSTRDLVALQFAGHLTMAHSVRNREEGRNISETERNAGLVASAFNLADEFLLRANASK